MDLEKIFSKNMYITYPKGAYKLRTIPGSNPNKTKHMNPSSK